ncbi:MAG: ATP-dependent DNA helicase RecG [Spirochaetes bacterium]|nr:MAG: ATP-dependent DNA helicase RecG [Spirochaetota bacterium]
MFLREYNKDIRFVKGVGPVVTKILSRLGIKTVSDLLLHFPRSYEDRRHIDKLADALTKSSINAVVRVIAQDSIGWGRKKTLKVYVEDSSARAALVCFGRNYLSSVLIPGRSFFVSGKFAYKFGEIQSTSFEVEKCSTSLSDFARIVPIYPLTEGLTQNLIRRIVRNAFLSIDKRIENEIPSYLAVKYSFPGKYETLRKIHFPEALEDIEKARRALAYEELFYFQLVILRKRIKRIVVRTSRKTIPFSLKKKLLKRLPFKLTRDQLKVLAEVEHDLFSEHSMMRMLQGDVGCGKTLVAFISALSVIEAGEQAALMVPTELLARQHAENAALLLEPLGVRIAILTGSISGRERKYLLSSLKNGDIELVIGTHALFSSDVEYNNLGYVIVDEQHRFGVMQRVALTEKGSSPDLLLMTATPIPRTLSLTAFGDLDISWIREMPKGRRKIITHLAREGNEDKVYRRIDEELDKKHQAYFVYPLIEESEVLSLKDAESMYKYLKEEVFKKRNIALIHSRIPEPEKSKVMERFISGSIDILVSTSVVEVGVDVPNATCMVIEHAERFGLSALHQLRGRVGRGKDQSFAFLIYGNKLTEDGIKRLKVIMETTDGFKISEEDLKIRGPGEVLGVKQSGFLKFKAADIVNDADILYSARKDAENILNSDPGFINPENRVIARVLTEAPPFDDTFLQGG